MQSSKISNLKFPFLIHKRNKGHAEVLGICDFEANTYLEAYEFLIYLIKYSKTLITIDELHAMFEDILEFFSITECKFNLNFSHFIDRASINYLLSPYELQCSYVYTVSNGVKKAGMSIIVPVNFKSYNNFMGTLKYVIYEPKTLFFEDIFDFVLKNCHIKIYPILSIQDMSKLQNIFDMGKDPGDYIHILENDKTLGNHGEIIVYYKDIYSMYHLEIAKTW